MSSPRRGAGVIEHVFGSVVDMPEPPPPPDPDAVDHVAAALAHARARLARSVPERHRGDRDARVLAAAEALVADVRRRRGAGG